MLGGGPVIVTGGSRGIGRAIALRLASDGYDIAFCYRTDTGAAEETASLVRALEVDCFHDQCDVSEYGAVEQFVKSAERNLGPAAALINSAGIISDAPLALMRLEAWRDVMAVNLTGTFNFCRSIAFRMMKQRQGVIVNLSSVVGVSGNAGQANYAASKAGIIGMSKSLAKEMAPFGVRVNVVAPGLIDTEMIRGISEKAATNARARIALGRFGSAANVADAVAFLASDKAEYITGQVLQVDGGMAL